MKQCTQEKRNGEGGQVLAKPMVSLVQIMPLAVLCQRLEENVLAITPSEDSNLSDQATSRLVFAFRASSPKTVPGLPPSPLLD